MKIVIDTKSKPSVIIWYPDTNSSGMPVRVAGKTLFDGVRCVILSNYNDTTTLTVSGPFKVGECDILDVINNNTGLGLTDSRVQSICISVTKSDLSGYLSSCSQEILSALNDIMHLDVVQLFEG